MSQIDLPVPGAPRKDIHLRDYWKVVWQGRWTALGVFLCVVGATALWTFLQTPIYRAVAVIEIQTQVRRLAPGQDVSGMGAGGLGWFAEERYQATQIEVIRSRAVMERAFRAVGLPSDPRFRDAPDPVNAFKGYITVEPRRETGLIEIKVENPNADEAARWANAVADAYVKRNLERAQENARTALEKLSGLMDPLKRNLTAAEQDRLAVLKSTEIYNPDSQQSVVRQRLERLNQELGVTQIEVATLGSLLAKVRDLQSKGADPMTLPELSNDEQLKDLGRQLVEAQKLLEKVRVDYRPGAPVYQQAESQVNRLRQGIRDQIAAKLGTISNDYDLKQRKAADLKDEIAKAEQEAFRLSLATSQYNVAKTDSETKKQIFDAITRTMNEVSLSADLLTNNVSLLDSAIPPLAPVKPTRRMNLILGSLVGLFLGVATVFFLDYLDNTFRTSDDIEEHLGLTTLAVVPRYGDAERGSRAVKEAYQTLRTSLIFSSRSREKRVVLITSTAPQEGKSSTTVQLARALAGAGDRVIVIDCDLRRPTLHAHFGVGRDSGVTNFLAAKRGEDDWTPYVVALEPSNLHVIPAGPIPPNPPELLGSERFVRMLRELRDAYDWVVLDSPPAASLSDATLLSSLAELVVLVIRHNHTDRDLVARAVQALRNVNASIAGVVLNNVDLDRAYKKDYYYAGYYYETADGAEGASKPRSREKTGTRA